MNGYNRDRFVMGAVLAALIGFFFFVIKARERSDEQWNSFAKAHKCRVVERRPGDVNTTVLPIVHPNGSVSVGTGFTFEDDKTAYLCDDGVKYWR